MTDESEPAPPPPLRRRRRAVARGVAALMVLALVVLWLVRKPIAEHYIDRTLASSGVPARYGIADLGLGRQRLTNVVVGDPADPDLVADWIETETSVGLSGATLSGVRAGRLRLRGTLANGRVSFGAIDRLLPASSGKPFALPALDLRVADGRMRLTTPYGIVGVALTGSGRLDAGFTGRAAIVGARLGPPGCTIDGLATALRVRTARGGAIRLDGPLRTRAIACRGVATGALRSDVVARIVTADRLAWTLDTHLSLDRVARPGISARVVTGTATLHDSATGAAGSIALAASDARAAGVVARRVALDGTVTLDRGTPGYRGAIALADADAAALLPAGIETLAAGTPAAPFARRMAVAARQAASRFAANADVAVLGSDIAIARLAATSSSGARASATNLAWAATGLAMKGTASVAGGGLPAVAARVTRSPQGAWRGVATVAPYATADASLSLTPVAFAVDPRGTGRIVTTATVSGPIGDGRVDALSLPLDARWSPRGGVLNPACAPLSWRRIAVAGLVLDPASLALCPAGGALATLAEGRVAGGARLGTTQLAGRLGTTPLTLAATAATLDLAARDLALRDVRATLGAPARVTRLAFATVTARLAGAAVAGTVTGGAGQIANVPLLLGAAAGDWTFRDGAFALTGTMTFADAAAAPRFQPLDVRAVSLRLAAGQIAATGTLYEPTRGVKVADVAIRHALGDGRGDADLAVPGIAFAKDFQPDLLTRLTFGVIADVRGSVAGEGHIGWTPAGVTSTGEFRTAGTDLAAAFGPVTGISGTIRFTDLLALESAPAQVATVATINPGIAVTDGTITYQTYRDSRILVAGARWPFAGGSLSLDPTLLDFATAQPRRLTFRIDGAAADRFLQQFDFKNLDATGTFDGVLPMIFDERGGRIEGGRLTARAGGGGLAYVGDLTQKDLGLWGNIAFQALKSLRYRDLGIVMNGPLAGEMVTEVRFAGISQGAGAKSNFLVRRLQKLPFVFNIRIKAPFRGLLDSAASFYDPSRLIQRNLPQLLERQRRAAPPAIQPPESEKMP